MDFGELQKLVFYEYQENGYLEMWNQGDHNMNTLAELGLIVTEVAEAMEEVRSGGEGFLKGEELADIIIRTMNIASRLGLDLEAWIHIKNEHNLKRGKLHGKTI